MDNEIDFSDAATYQMMAGMAIPEQAVMMYMAPDMPLQQRLLVSAVMYGSSFAFNGFVKKAPTLTDEFKWIVPTAMYGAYVTGNPQVGLMLAAADTAMTLYLRSDGSDN